MSKTSAALDLDPAIEKKMLGALVFAVLVLALMAAAALQNNSRQAQSAAWVNHTHAFILETDAILSSLNAAEAAERTFLLTGDDPSKQRALAKFAEIAEHLGVAGKLAFENPDQLKRLDAITTLLQKQIDANKEAFRLRTENPGGASAALTNPQIRTNLAEIERQIAASKAAENQLLLEREQTLQRHTRRTEQILYAGGALNALLLALTFYVVRLDITLRRSATEVLEAKVRERTAELAEANEKLQLENIEQKWGEASLKRLVGHHELILNSIREGIFVISRNGHIISANPAAAELTKRDATQLAGKSIATFLRDGDSVSAWDKHFLAESVKTGAPITARAAQISLPDGATIPVEIACHPARDRENLTGAVITVAKNLG